MSFFGYAMIIAALLAYCLWFVGMLINERFRLISNEVWGHYWIHALKFAWPYAIIYFLYKIIEDGSLATTLRSAFH